MDRVGEKHSCFSPLDFPADVGTDDSRLSIELELGEQPVHDLDEQAFVELVLEEWWDAAAHALPWAAMPLDDRFGELRRLASALVASAVVNAGRPRDPQEAARNGVISAAIQHGRFRGRQGGTWELLLFELTFLSDALRISVRELELPAALTSRLERELAAGLRVAKPACSLGMREAANEASASDSIRE